MGIISPQDNGYRVGSCSDPSEKEIEEVLEAAREKAVEEMERTKQTIRKKFREIYG